MHKNQSGFTLIEVLIAIAILAIITISIVSVTNNSQTTKDRVVNEDRENLQIETALSRMEWDISQLFTPLYFLNELKVEHFLTGEEALDQKNTARYNQIVDDYQRNTRFAFPASNMTPVPINDTPNKGELVIFTTSNRRKLVNIRQSHFAWIKYAVISDPLMKEGDDEKYNGKALVRYQLVENPFSREEINWEDIKPQVLLRNVESINFSFWDETKDKFIEGLDLIRNGRNLIRAIKIFIEWKNADGNMIEVEKIIRPLYPNFKPEDLTKYLQKGATANPNGEGGSASESEGEGAGGDDGFEFIEPNEGND